MCCTFAQLKSHPPTTCVIDHSLMCLTHLPFVPHHLRRHRLHTACDWNQEIPCATPHGGLQFGRLVEPTPLTGYDPKTCIDVSSEQTPVSYLSRRNSVNTDYNDLTTTVAVSETPDMKEVGQSTSPLLLQEREETSNPFCVSGFQQQAGGSGSQQQASPSVVSPWLSADL